MQFSCNYSQMSDADFCQVAVARGMWPLSYYFTQVETATEKVNLRCGLVSNYSCDGNSTLCTFTLDRHCP